MKVFTVDAPLESSEKKTAIASTQLTMLPTYKVVEKTKNNSSTLVKVALFVVFAFLLAAVLTVVISEYAWKNRDGTHLFRMRWEDIRSKFQGEPSFEAPVIPVQIDDPSSHTPLAVEPAHIVLQKPDDEANTEQPNQSPLVDLEKLNLLRTLVERIREHNEQQSNMPPDVGTIAVLSVEPFQGPRSSEETDESHEPAVIDDPSDIPIQIHPPMPPHHRGGGPPRPFGPWPSDDYYSAAFYPDYQQYPDHFGDSFGPHGGHNRPRHHNGPPPPPFDAMEFSNGPDQQYPDFSPEQFAAGPPPPPFGRHGPHHGGPFNRPPMPDMGDYAEGPWSQGPSGGRDGPPPPPPPFGRHSGDFTGEGQNGPSDGQQNFGMFGGPPPPQFGPFPGPPPSFGRFGGQEEPREEASNSQQPTIRITQHFADKNSDRPSSIVTEIYGGKRMQEMVGDLFVGNTVNGMNPMNSMNPMGQPQDENNNDQLLPPWMKPQFGPNAGNPSFMQGSSQNANPFLPVSNQMQMFNPFPGMNQMQSPPGGMMNQFNSAPGEISQQQFQMNPNQAQPMVQQAPFFQGPNQMQQDPTGQFQPDMPPFMAQNGQNDAMFPNHVFPMGNNRHPTAQQPIQIGTGAFPSAGMQQPQPQMGAGHPMFNGFQSPVGPQGLNQQPSDPSMDIFDPSMMGQNNGPQVHDVTFSPEVQHWNEEMLEKNQHRFEGMTPEMFAASLNLTPDMASQPPTSQEQQEIPHQPPVANTFGMDFNDQGMFFAPPMPASSSEDKSASADDHPNVQPSPPTPVVFHFDTPQERGPPAVAPQEPAVPAVAPQEPAVSAHSQDIPQPPIWSHPLELTQHADADTPILSRSEGVADSK